jgi:hypothetical protein
MWLWSNSLYQQVQDKPTVLRPSEAEQTACWRPCQLQPPGEVGKVDSLAEQGFRGNAKEPAGDFWVTRKITLLLKPSKKNECVSDSLF